MNIYELMVLAEIYEGVFYACCIGDGGFAGKREAALDALMRWELVERIGDELEVTRLGDDVLTEAMWASRKGMT